MSRAICEIRDVLGRVLILENPYIVKEWEGLGPTSSTHVVSVGVFQDGETFIDAPLAARTIRVGLDIAAENPENLWVLRQALIRKLTPLVLGCYFKVTLPAGEIRETFGRYTGLPAFGRSAGDGPLRQRVVFALRCASAALYDPAGVVWVYAIPPGASKFAFPLSFPVAFGPTGLAVEETKQYDGSLPAYPVIAVEGPAENLIIQNLTTDDLLDFNAKNYDIAADETVVIDTRYGHKSVTSTVNGNILKHLSDDSDLGTFHIAPDPEAVDGKNTISVDAGGITVETSIRFEFKTQYSGV